MNWWKEGVGLSIIRVYNDRADTSTVDHSFTLYIKNKYSVGYVHRKDSNSNLLQNLNLVEVFGEKIHVYKKYKSYF